ncbi:hypothetical protein DMI60_25445 [Escherichia coli]|nr:hypothetical protein [Escherichia coli]
MINAVKPGVYRFDYSRTLAQKEFPVGLRSWLMREYGDDTAHNVSGFEYLYRIPVTNSPDVPVR